MQAAEPLILTLKLDDNAQAFFNDLRRQYFPPERNFLDAHLTLFHHLPAGQEEIFDLLQTISQQQKEFTVAVTNVVSIGNGVAYKCESGELQSIHQYLQREWQQWLIPQDKQKLWPHITIQNKVDADAAKATLVHLSSQFNLTTIKATGFSLWKYLGGPWDFVTDFRFQ